MIQHYAQPPLFGTEPITDDDDLFDLIEQTCTDCGATFSTSRRATRCALCASLRSGEVGPATVLCPGCGVEHQVPVLAPHKLCKCCTVDLEMTAGALRARLDAAQAAADEAWERMDADLAHADDSDRARYDAACERAAEWEADRWARARDAAIAKGDGLSPLLVARLRLDDAVLALDRAKAEVALGLDEVERAQG